MIIIKYQGDTYNKDIFCELIFNIYNTKIKLVIDSIEENLENFKYFSNSVINDENNNLDLHFASNSDFKMSYENNMIFIELYRFIILSVKFKINEEIKNTFKELIK